MLRVCLICLTCFIFSNNSYAEGTTFTQRGVASNYGRGDGLNGSKTANGERFNTNALTAAHRSLPFNSKVEVTHGSKSVIVRINDRGPFRKGRIIDLSYAAARAIACTGLCRVDIKVLNF